LSFFILGFYEIFMRIDDTDRRLLRQLLAEPTLSTAALAERAGVTEATCWRRLEKLRAGGVLIGQQAVINWRALGWAVEVSLRFTLEKSNPRAFDEFIAAAREVPEVLEIQTFLGRVDVRLNVIARDMGHYQQIYRDRILTLPHIADIEALMHVAEIKRGAGLPI
jgi:Lrp/AsnC family transcriptional regulator